MIHEDTWWYSTWTIMRTRSSRNGWAERVLLWTSDLMQICFQRRGLSGWHYAEEGRLAHLALLRLHCAVHRCWNFWALPSCATMSGEQWDERATIAVAAAATVSRKSMCIPNPQELLDCYNFASSSPPLWVVSPAVTPIVVGSQVFLDIFTFDSQISSYHYHVIACL